MPNKQLITNKPTDPFSSIVDKVAGPPIDSSKAKMIPPRKEDSMGSQIGAFLDEMLMADRIGPGEAETTGQTLPSPSAMPFAPAKRIKKGIMSFIKRSEKNLKEILDPEFYGAFTNYNMNLRNDIIDDTVKTIKRKFERLYDITKRSDWNIPGKRTRDRIEGRSRSIINGELNDIDRIIDYKKERIMDKMFDRPELKNYFILDRAMNKVDDEIYDIKGVFPSFTDKLYLIADDIKDFNGNGLKRLGLSEFEIAYLRKMYEKTHSKGFFVVDMKKNLERGNTGPLTDEQVKSVNKALEKLDQIKKEANEFIDVSNMARVGTIGEDRANQIVKEDLFPEPKTNIIPFKKGGPNGLPGPFKD